MRIYRKVVSLLHIPVLVENGDGRSLGPVGRGDDDLVTVEGIFVGSLLTEGDSVDHVLEPCLTGNLDNGDCIVGIPLADEVALCNLVSVSFVEN